MGLDKRVMAASGARHEQNVAFYLRRAFSNKKDVYVFNNVKITHEGENAQIDHLILYKYGFIVIESKSIKGEVKVNQNGEWARSYNSQWYGIPSPVEQAKNQIAILKTLLQENADGLLGKILGLQKGFGARQYSVLVAVSSSAIIHREGMPPDIDEITLKSEFIAARVEKIMASHVNRLWRKDTLPWFTSNEMEAIAVFLGQQEVGLQPDPAPTQSSDEGKPAQEPGKPVQPQVWLVSCKHCRNEDGLIARYGKYGYYVACPKCEKNTPLKQACPACESKATKVTKQKLTYTLGCAQCGDVGSFTSAPDRQS